MDSEERVETKRFLKRLQQENKEREMAEALRIVCCIIIHDFFLPIPVKICSEQCNINVIKLI